MIDLGEWLHIDCERVLYADYGNTVVLCDRLPSPVTLVVKISSDTVEKLAAYFKARADLAEIRKLHTLLGDPRIRVNIPTEK